MKKRITTVGIKKLFSPKSNSETLKKKLKISPLFLVVLLVCVYTKNLSLFCATLLAVLLHEYAHYVVAKCKGYRLSRLKLLPFGAVLGLDSGLNDRDLFAVAVAGPLSNGVIALFIVALWWIYPSSHGYTYPLFRANIAIAIFNILPLYPLDGSRIVQSFFKNKTRCLKVLRVLSYVFSAVCLVLFIVSAFFTISLSLALVSLMLFSGAAFDGEQERYIQLCRQMYVLKDFSRPFRKQELYVHTTVKISALKRELRNDCIYLIHIVDGSFRVLKTLVGEDLESIFSVDPTLTIGSFL